MNKSNKTLFKRELIKLLKKYDATIDIDIYGNNFTKYDVGIVLDDGNQYINLTDNQSEDFQINQLSVQKGI